MPKTKIPGTAELVFIQTVASGTVHIEVRYASYDTPYPVVEDIPADAAGFEQLLTAATVTLCGRRTHPAWEIDHHYTGCFNDERLCQQCYRRLHPDDVGRAFEHRQPGDIIDEY